MMIISAFFCIFITTMFVYKLFNVYRAPNFRDDDLLSIITKNTILALISILSTILNGIILFIAWNHSSNLPLWYFKDFCFVLEIYTNFICILLTYRHFKKQYVTFCGFMDRRCKSCCTDITNNYANNSQQREAERTVTTLTMVKVNSMSQNSSVVM
eukprot:UN12124